MIGGRAVVVGGSVAGMVAARVLAEQFDEVVVLERDPAEGRRKGVPQSDHVHVLLRRGVEILERLFPQIHAEMVAGQVRPFDFARDLRWFQHGGWLPRPTSGVVTYPQTRRCLEGHIRRRLHGVPNVRVLAATGARGLVATDDASRVTGVQAEGPEGAFTLPAALVVDAAGRGSAVYRWLEALGCPPIAETSLAIDLAYVSRFYRPPPRPRDWRGLWISPAPPGCPRGGALQMVEGDRWLLSLCGYHGDRPSADPERFAAFASSLQDPAIARAIEGATPLSEPVLFRVANERWRHVERAERFPAGLVILGDAHCSFDPVFGQGMTVAMIACEHLQRHLARVTDARGLTRAWTAGFYAEWSLWLRTLWAFATGEALRHPETPGERDWAVRASQAAVDEIYALCREDPANYCKFLRLMHMQADLEFFLRPTVALRLARRLGGLSSLRGLAAGSG